MTSPDRQERFRAFGRPGAGLSLRVRGWLLALALVPLAGASWFAYKEVDDVAMSRRHAEQVAQSTDELLDLKELQAHVLDERSWTIALAGIEALGIEASLVKSLTGIDFDEHNRDAEMAVDDLILKVGWPELRASALTARSEPNMSLEETRGAYGMLAQSVGQHADRSLDELLTIAGDISDGSELESALRVLEASALARQAVTIQVTNYFPGQFVDPVSALVGRESLAEQRALYNAAMADVGRIAGTDTRVTKALAALRASDDVVTFREALTTLIANPPGARDVDDINIFGVFGRLDRITVVFQAATASVEEHKALVNAAGSDVQATSRELDRAAAASGRQAQIRIAILVAGSLLFAMGLARAIGRPLQQLAGSAQNLRDGHGTSPLRPSGPTEVREAMRAINEASAHLGLAERQAQALARGELDDPALTETSPGALGQSLQDAVHTLTSSLGQSEEFQKQLAHEATHDSLTQLANRKASLARLDSGLARASRTDGSIAIMFIDLDRFKDVNDRHGHPAGDRVLCVVSERLTDAIRAGDHVGRLGGDEFLVVAEPIRDAADALLLAERIIDLIAQPMLIGSTSVSVTASIGIALADRATTLTADGLLHDADLAVYKAKELGRSRVELCDEALHAELVNRSAIELALRDGILSDELTLYYQPIVDAGDGRVVSLEALVRWDRPGFGMTYPDAFIPIAERSDLILSLDRWVLRHVAEQLAAWTDHEVFGQIPIAINISGRHLAAEAFVANVLEPIRGVGVNPARIVIEITESALLDDLESAAKNLELLRREGIRVAIDDFGTGYTSLGHLRTLPIDILKIDRTFTADTTASSLMKLIIDTGHLLGVRIVAEGIETHEQAAHLAELGSDELQGYLYGRPAPPAELKLDDDLSESLPPSVVTID